MPHHRNSYPRVLLALLFALASLMTGGCSRSGDADSENLHIKQISELYRAYVAAHRGELPPDEATLKKYAKSLSPQLLEAMGIKDVDAGFSSPRDSLAYVVAYGPSKTMGVVIAYERKGVDGTRLVATREGAASKVGEDEFRKLMAEK